MDRRIAILVVDDDREVCRTLADILELHGHLVNTAENAIEALHLLKNMPVDLALIDIAMPEVNGVQLLQEVKRLNPAIRSIMITAFHDSELIGKARDIGAQEVLFKPLDIDRLLMLLNSA